MALQLRVKNNEGFKFDKDVISKLEAVCNTASMLCNISYRVPVYLFPVPVFTGTDSFNVGYFRYSGTLCSIELAGARSLRDITITLAHELVHLEQWLDGDDPMDDDCEQEARLREKEIYNVIKKEIRGAR